MLFSHVSHFQLVLATCKSRWGGEASCWQGNPCRRILRQAKWKCARLDPLFLNTNLLLQGYCHFLTKINLCMSSAYVVMFVLRILNMFILQFWILNHTILCLAFVSCHVKSGRLLQGYPGALSYCHVMQNVMNWIELRSFAWVSRHLAGSSVILPINFQLFFAKLDRVHVFGMVFL